MTLGISTDTVKAPTPDEYDLLEVVVAARGRDLLKSERRVFTTDADHLFEQFLAVLPADIRQVHDCHCCRRFFATYGGLVTIGEDGRTTPLLWSPDEVPLLYKPAVTAVARLVSKAKVTGVFFSEEKTWGLWKTPGKNGVTWSHLAVTPNPDFVFKKDATLKSAEQVSAEKGQDYEMLHRGLAEFSRDLCVKAHSLLSNGQLFRSEKCEGVAKWLVELHTAKEAAKGQDAKNNVVWRAVAFAPAGFAHVRSGMIGTLLEDLASGMDFGTLKRRFDEKMNPLQYQRATAPLSDGNRERAEKVITELGLGKSLERRFAKIEDVLPNALWVPTPSEPVKAGGIFGHLKTDKTKPTEVVGPPVTMTWDKFQRTVLPDAKTISYLVPFAVKPYFGLVTAEHADAPPILQWDSPEKRNPVSWYFYVGGSSAVAWNLAMGAHVPVKAIALKPSMWTEGFTHQGAAAFFFLEGAWDRNYVKSAGFFTETLKSTLHEIRATLEAYQMTAVVSGAREATANGVALQAGEGGRFGQADLVFRVTGKNGIVTDYKLDRWD